MNEEWKKKCKKKEEKEKMNKEDANRMRVGKNR